MTISLILLKVDTIFLECHGMKQILPVFPDLRISSGIVQRETY